MGVTPRFRITANDVDITAALQDRLVSLRWTDEIGFRSDMLEITLTDHDPARRIRMPTTGAELKVYAGYDDTLRYIGLFAVDEVELDGPPDEMVIRAHAAVQDETPSGKGSLRSHKTRAWPRGTTLGGIVRQMAAEHSMLAGVSARLAGTPLPILAQTDESDLNFLLRIAKRYGAVVKPVDGRIILALADDYESVSGRAMPHFSLQPQDVSRWNRRISRREAAGSVLAYWHDFMNAQRHEVTAGTGEPSRRLRRYYPTAEMALAAAEADLRRRGRLQNRLTLSLPGNPDIRALCLIILAGFRDGVNGTWPVIRAEHTISPDDGYRTDVEAESMEEKQSE